jgi:hypothetical protein
MSEAMTLTAHFTDFEGWDQALAELKQAGLTEVECFGGTPLVMEIEGHMPRRGSPVRKCATVGGIVGACTGFGLAIYASLSFGQWVGGKPPVSMVPFCIVGFEFTILVACLATMLSFLFFARMRPMLDPPAEAEAAYSDLTYGIHVRCKRSQVGKATRVLQEAGATQIGQDGTTDN